MTRMFRLTGLTAALIGILAAAGTGENSITIDPMTVAGNMGNVQIRILLVNDAPLSAVVLPLVLRTTSGGAFIKTATLSFGDRLANYLTDYEVTNQYATEDGTCDSTCGCTRGFKTIAAISGKNPVSGSPYGVYWVRARFNRINLPPGADAVGSIVLTVDIDSLEGTFSIDTTCTNPYNHPILVDSSLHSIRPEFQGAVITVVGDCCGLYTGGVTGNTNCDLDGNRDLSDITRLIDRVYVSHTSLCCEANGNTDGSANGQIDLSDITRLIDFVYISHRELAACQ
jgi:hypothetical protein